MSQSDGHIILRTKVDTSGVSKGGEKIKKDLAKMQRDFDKTTEAIEKTETRIKELYAELDNIQTKAFKAPDTNKPVFTPSEQKQIEKINSELSVLEPKLQASRTKATELGAAIKDATKGNIPAVKTISKGMSDFGKRIATLTKRVFVFSVILKGLRMLADVIKNVAMGDDEFRKSVEQLQAALWVAFTPIMNVVIPALKAMVNWLTQAAIAVGKFFAAISGKSYSALIKNAKALKKQSDNYKNLSKNAKDAKKQLAGFDEIDILARGESGGSVADVFGFDVKGMDFTATLAAIGMVTGWALVGLGIILMFSGHPFVGIGMVAMGFAFTYSASTDGANLGEEEKKKLATIGTIVGVALIGLGVLLLFTQSWKYGLAMVATGATAMYSAYTLGEFSQDASSHISKILLIAGIVAFTLGVILLLVNKPKIWKYGLGLMALGVTEVVGALSFGGDELINELKSFVIKYWKEIYAIGALITVAGIVLLFCKQWKFGLTLLIAGIATVATATVLGGDELLTALRGFIVKYKDTIIAISAVAVVVGIVLLFCSQWGIGLTLIAAGIGTMYGATKLGGDELLEALRSYAIKYADIIFGISTLVLIVGIVLLFCQQWAIGLTIVALSIGAFYGTTKLGGDELKQQILAVIDPWLEELMAISAAVFVLGIILLFVPGCVGIGLALLAAGAVGLYGTTKRFDSTELSRQLRTELDGVNEVAQTGVNKINTTLSSINYPENGTANTMTLNVPKLARGAVLPANKPFLAMVGDQKHGTNIEAPLETIVEAMNIALQNNDAGQTTTKEEHYYLGETELMSIVYKLFKGGERLNGTSLITGGGY